MLYFIYSNQRALDERQRRQSEDSTQPVSSGNSSTSEPPPPPPVMATSPPPSINTSPAPIISSQHSQDKDDVESLRSLLQEVLNLQFIYISHDVFTLHV